MASEKRIPESMRAAYEAANSSLTDWSEPPQERRDWKKLFLVTGLAILSWVATYVGMLELIEANMGELPIVHKVIIGFSVAMLMTMIVWLLDQLFAPIGFFTKLCYAAGYVFLTIISVGFGFGFYWKVLESKGEGTRGAETAISQVQSPLQTAAARLESLTKTLDTLQTTSAQKAEIERTQGTSCPNSRPGDGPRRKLRDDDAARFAFARDVIKGRIQGIKGDIAAIDADLVRIVQNDASIVDKSGTRNDFMKAVGRKLDTTVTNFNAFKGDPQLKQIRVELDERAGKSQFIDTQGKPYSCPDAGLATMIRAVVASIDALPTLEKPKINTVEGSDATVEAFRRLTATFYGALAFKLPPSADELRDSQKKAVATIEGGKPALTTAQLEGAGLSKRDYIPLAIAIFVDICLLLVSMGRPMNRLGNLVPKMQAAEKGPVIQILSRFNEIHRDRQIRENFEIFRHVVFDMNGDYYVAVPLDAPPRMNPKDREELRLEAQLLANLFTSFEKEKIFTRVLMPIISVKSIQKKLWKQGSKFAHSETFRLYKFKDGAWSEIILGAIMGAAKRVETEKRRRRIEDDLFARHEPTFTGAVSEAAQRAATGTPQPPPMPHGMAPAPPPPPPAMANWQVPAPPPPRGYAPAAAYQPAFGPYAAAAAHQMHTPPPAEAVVAAYPQHLATPPQRRAEPVPSPVPGVPDTVADLREYKSKLEQQADVSVRIANNNTAPVEAASRPQSPPPAAAPRPDISLVPPERAPDAAPASEPTVKVEAIERKVVFHMPTGTADVPPTLAALMASSRTALETPAHAETKTIALPAPANETAPVEGEAEEALFEPWTGKADDDTPTMASRFAPPASRS